MTNMNQDICNRCGSVMKIVPAGVSKRTGKKYAAFKACPDRECKPSFQGEKPQESSNIDKFKLLTEQLDRIEGQLSDIDGALYDIRSRLDK